MNKVFLIGNLTRDPELTETENGTSLCRFSIGVARNYTTAGERKTDFFNCTAWRGTAEAVARYAHKGNKIAVSGSIELRNYEGNDGVKKTAVDIVAQDVEFLTPRQTENSEDAGHDVPKGNTRRTQLTAFDDGDIPF